MNLYLQNLSQSDVGLLLRITERLSAGQDRKALRQDIAQDVLRLLRADFFASFIWDPDRKVFDEVVFLNMTSDNIERYQSYFRLCDPITPVLQKKRRATLVSEIMPQKELERTEFFNDFLMADGLHHGINLYAYDGDENVGDLRIWRAKRKPVFGKREAVLLDTILPYFRNALVRAKAMEETRQRAAIWEELFDISDSALFLFDEDDHPYYKNRRAGAFECGLAPGELSAFNELLGSLTRGEVAQANWGPYSFSASRIVSPVDSRSFTAVKAGVQEAGVLDKHHIQTRHRLSGRESDIALLVCKGLTDQEIASALGIAFSTVRTHVKRLFLKLDVTTRTEMIFALLEGIVDISY